MNARAHGHTFGPSLRCACGMDLEAYRRTPQPCARPEPEPDPAAYRRVTTRERRQWQDAYDAGQAVAAIARHHDRAYETIRRHVEHDPAHRLARTPPGRVWLWWILRQAGWRWVQIARMAGKPQQTVSRCVRRQYPDSS